MEFRQCRDEEYTAVRQLWGQCFGDEEPWTSWYFSMHYQAERTWVGVDAGTIVAQVHLLPHRLMLRGAWRDVVYIVGVCVDEARRSQGIGRALLAAALAELKRNDVGITILQPRWPIFYQKLGWGYCYARQAYRFPVTVAELLLSDNSANLSWLPDTKETEVLPSIYEAFVQSRHGYALRSESDWRSLLADHVGAGGRVGIFFLQDSPCGYVLYSSIENRLNVREMVWSAAAKPDMFWQWIIGAARLAGDETVEWMDPSEDMGSVLSAEEPSEPFLMGRINDVQTVLEAVGYPADLSVELEMEVSDPLAQWNVGRFHWTIRGGRGQIYLSTATGSPDLEIGIGTLSRLLFGQIPAEQILSAGEDHCGAETIKLLAKIFPGRRNFISEYF